MFWSCWLDCLSVYLSVHPSGHGAINSILGMIQVTLRVQDMDYDPDRMDWHETFTKVV